MDERLDFLFLTEEEAVQAGAKDMPRCIEVMDEMFSLLGQGDYLTVSYTHLTGLETVGGQVSSGGSHPPGP